MKENKPKWDDAPDWANWLAQDSDGGWYWYEKKPEIEEEGWNDSLHYTDNRFEFAGAIYWKDSLERKPNDH